MDRDVILAYLFNCGAIRERGMYDVNNNPKIEIKSLRKVDNYYKVCGNLSIELGDFCKEDDLFRAVFMYDDNGIIINSEIQSVNSFMPFNDFSSNYVIKGEVFKQRDTFRLISNNGKMNICHNINDGDDIIIESDNCNSLEKCIVRDLSSKYNYNKKNYAKRGLKRFRCSR